MSSSRPAARRRARPVFDGPTYMAPQYHSRLWGRLIFLLLVLMLCALVGGGGGLYWALHRAQGSSTQAVLVRVTNGDSVNSLAGRLRSQGLIGNSLLFKLDARIQNLSGKLKPGVYRFRRNMSIDQMVAALSIYHLNLISVTIPPGYRIGQIAARLQQNGIDARSFLQEAEHPNPAYLGASILRDKPRNASLEGYLLPETYDVQPHSSGRAFARLMVLQLDREFTPAMRAAAAARKWSVYDVLTLASIVEREARVPDERPVIAGVYTNRLRIGMKLQADPTVQYADGTPSDWWPVLQTQAVNVKPSSPYNTYTHLGLPPGPIANPGLPSIIAALHPKPTGYLFFLAIPHGHGRHVFARTYQEQLANQQKYGY